MTALMEKLAEVTINGRPGEALIWAYVTRKGDMVYLKSEADAPMLRDAWFSDGRTINIAVDYLGNGGSSFSHEVRITEFSEAGGKVSATMAIVRPAPNN